MGYWMVARRRWKCTLWLLLLVVVLINTALFVGFTGTRVGDQLGVTKQLDESHLQLSSMFRIAGCSRAVIPKLWKHSWEIFHKGIHQNALYDPEDEYLKMLLDDMVTKEVVDVEQKEGGTQLKLIITLEDDGQALFKPMRFPREQETLPDHFYFPDYERHNAEIAAFHLDMLLGFHCVPPTVGRLMNVSQDLHRLANRKLAKTFFISPVAPEQKPHTDNPLPLLGLNISQTRMSDYMALNYSQDETSGAERGPVRRAVRGRVGPGETSGEGQSGARFGRSKYDCMSCIAPVRQCCLIRLSTLAKLVKLYIGPDSLSHVLRESLKADPSYPVLWEPHLDALDRRLGKILSVVSDCVNVKGKPWNEVVLNDGIN
ncbi:hypothetical protein Btru_068982 [Bulinus truncatus]|nr:hypothetical protein Btru_068982 [Bulinus truncatus]